MSTFTNEKFRITVRIPHFGSIGTVAFLKFLAFSEPVANKEAGGGETPQYKDVTFEFRHEYQTFTFLHTLKKTFHPDFFTTKSETVTEFDSSWEHLWEHLAAMVKAHDLHHEMSDDHRVWQSGQAELKAIKTLADKLAIIDRERVCGMVRGIYKLTA
jgi:hypothetical protein